MHRAAIGRGPMRLRLPNVPLIYLPGKVSFCSPQSRRQRRSGRPPNVTRRTLGIERRKLFAKYDGLKPMCAGSHSMGVPQSSDYCAPAHSSFCSPPRLVAKRPPPRRTSGSTSPRSTVRRRDSAHHGFSANVPRSTLAFECAASGAAVGRGAQRRSRSDIELRRQSRVYP